MKSLSVTHPYSLSQANGMMANYFGTINDRPIFGANTGTVWINGVSGIDKGGEPQIFIIFRHNPDGFHLTLDTGDVVNSYSFRDFSVFEEWDLPDVSEWSEE